MQQWYGKARLDVYDDPARLQLRKLPVRAESLTPTLLKALRMIEAHRQNVGQSGVLTKYVVLARSKKKGKQKSVRLPPALAEWKRILEEHGAFQREKLHERLNRQAKSRVLQVLCFLRVYGWTGLERWAVARLSPNRRMARWTMNRRARRLYRASRR